MSELVPFISTRQYKMFKATCDFIRARRKMGLTYGDAGAGKSSAARRYAREQPPMVANGLSPVFYLELEQTEKTDRALYNAFVATIRREPAENVTAKVASDEAKRLLDKYRYEFIIIDEFQFLQDSGLEAVRTLWDKTNIPILLITMTQFKGVLQKPKHKQLHSRIIRFLAFDQLDKKQLKKDLLSHIDVHSHITFDAEQNDADAIVDALFSTTRGNFREIMKVLDQANDLIDVSKKAVALHAAAQSSKPAPLVRRFDVATISEAAEMTMDTAVVG